MKLTVSTIGWLLILVITAVFIWNLIILLIATGEHASDAELCRNTLRARSAEVLSVPIMQDVQSRCPTTYFDYKNDAQMRAAIIASRQECWYKMGGDLMLNGNLDPFKDQGAFNSDKIFCTVCSVFELKERKLEGVNQGMLNSIYGKGVSEDIKQKDVIQGDHAMIFVVARGKDAIDRLLKPTGYAAGGAATMIIGGYLVKIGVGLASTFNPIGIIGGSIVATTGAVLFTTGGGTTAWSLIADHGEPELVPGVSLVKYNKEELLNLGCQEIK